MRGRGFGPSADSQPGPWLFHITPAISNNYFTLPFLSFSISNPQFAPISTCFQPLLPSNSRRSFRLGSHNDSSNIRAPDSVRNFWPNLKWPLNSRPRLHGCCFKEIQRTGSWSRSSMFMPIKSPSGKSNC